MRAPRTTAIRGANILLAALAMTVGACSDAFAPGIFGGSYDLRTIDGRELPLTSEEGVGSHLEVVGARVRARADGTFTYTTTFKDIQNDDDSSMVFWIPLEGTWTQTGDTVLLVTERGDTLRAFVDGDVLEIDSNGHLLRFER